MHEKTQGNHVPEFDTARARRLVEGIRAAMAKRIVGKREIVDGILTGVIAEGHVLLEGVPGLAKTLAVRVFAAATGLSFKRIQFTPDLLPGDVTGTLYYDSATGRFIPREGPVFANIVLADEINRAPAKVQSSLLEAMEERQVTMGDRTLPLPDPFFVLATQNPIEHEGTFRLPEAQLDRFMLKLLVDYPTEAEELDVVLSSVDPVPDPAHPEPALAREDLAFLKASAKAVRVDRDVAAYIVALVRASRPRNDTTAPSALRELWRYIEFGASPRAAICLYRAARVRALLDGRDYVLPDDAKASAAPVLRHRVLPSYEAEAERMDSETIVRGLLSVITVP